MQHHINQYSTISPCQGSIPTYLSTGGTQGAIRRHGDCVEVAGVAVVVGLQLAVGQTPHLKHTHTHSLPALTWLQGKQFWELSDPYPQK